MVEINSVDVIVNSLSKDDRLTFQVCEELESIYLQKSMKKYEHNEQLIKKEYDNIRNCFERISDSLYLVINKK
jgi:hypothetical protein